MTIKDNNIAHAYQLKYRGTKYAFIIALSDEKPFEVIIYRGAIIPRKGYLFKEGDILFFKGEAEGSRAKSLDHTIDVDSAALVDLVILAVSFGVPIPELIETLKSQKGTNLEFSKLLIKGLKKHYNV